MKHIYKEDLVLQAIVFLFFFLFFFSQAIAFNFKLIKLNKNKNLIGFPGGDSDKEPASQYRRHKKCGFNPWVGTIPWNGKWQPTPVLLPTESHGQKSLTGYSPWGQKELDRTENAQSTAQLDSSYMLVKSCSKFSKPGFSNT